MKLSDSHNDFFSILTENEYIPYLKQIKNFGVKNLLCSEFTSEYDDEIILQKLLKSKEILNKFGENNYKLHIEDLSFVNSKSREKFLINLKPYSVSLTWNYDNQFAGGNFGVSGLTTKGKKLINKLVQNGIKIDVAHLNHKSFIDVCNCLDGPIFCSHTGLDCILHSNRNLNNYEVVKIIDSGGYFGLFLSPKFMSTNNIMTAKKFASIIFKIIEKYGYKNFGIGSDFFGMEKYPENITCYIDFYKVIKRLRERGVNNFIINKIFYENFDRFLR